MLEEEQQQGGIMSKLCGWFGPGAMKIDHVKALLNEIMAVSTLLSGFSIGMCEL